jgi:hypothetical protein
MKPIVKLDETCNYLHGNSDWYYLFNARNNYIRFILAKDVCWIIRADGAVPIQVRFRFNYTI